MKPLASGPILPALLWLALPNVLAMAAAAGVGIAETFYVGLLGLEPLAAMAVVFPFAADLGRTAFAVESRLIKLGKLPARVGRFGAPAG